MIDKLFDNFMAGPDARTVPPTLGIYRTWLHDGWLVQFTLTGAFEIYRQKIYELSSDISQDGIHHFDDRLHMDVKIRVYVKQVY